MGLRTVHHRSVPDIGKKQLAYNGFVKPLSLNSRMGFLRP
jgi:hypothetical protein